MGEDCSLIITEFLNTEQTPLCQHTSHATLFQHIEKQISFLSKWICSYSHVTALEISLSFGSIFSSKLIKRKKKKCTICKTAAVCVPLECTLRPTAYECLPWSNNSSICPLWSKINFLSSVQRSSLPIGKLNIGANRSERHITKENHMHVTWFL